MIWTYEEAMAIPMDYPRGVFNAVYVLNTKEKHDSGFYMMRYVFEKNGEIVGACGGYSDVIHLNGIGGYGIQFEKALRTRECPVMDWAIDIPFPGCFRIFTRSKYMTLDDQIILSDFQLYDGGNRLL